MKAARAEAAALLAKNGGSSCRCCNDEEARKRIRAQFLAVAEQQGVAAPPPGISPGTHAQAPPVARRGRGKQRAGHRSPGSASSAPPQRSAPRALCGHGANSGCEIDYGGDYGGDIVIPFVVIPFVPAAAKAANQPHRSTRQPAAAAAAAAAAAVASISHDRSAAAGSAQREVEAPPAAEETTPACSRRCGPEAKDNAEAERDKITEQAVPGRWRCAKCRGPPTEVEPAGPASQATPWSASLRCGAFGVHRVPPPQQSLPPRRQRRRRRIAGSSCLVLALAVGITGPPPRPRAAAQRAPSHGSAAAGRGVGSQSHPGGGALVASFSENTTYAEKMTAASFAVDSRY